MRAHRTNWRSAYLIVALGAVMSACGGGGDSSATAASTPVDPAGVWKFSLVNTVATGVCSDENGDASVETITITKTGSRAPYQVTAVGFLGLAGNVLTGTFDAKNKLTISGSYPEDGGTTTTTHTLTATSDNQMVGTENWSWTGGGGSCPGSKASVTANRQ